LMFIFIILGQGDPNPNLFGWGGIARPLS